MKPVHLALASFSLASVLSAQIWTQQFPVQSPSVRYGGAAAFDGRGNVVIYGGLLQPTAITAETWGWNGTTWSQLSPSTPPPPRWGHQMVFDAKRRRIVAFGGRSPTITATANDTWEYDGVTWMQMSPTASPTARAFYSMAYDERRGRTMIFGSQSTFDGNQLWEYDGTTWVQVQTKTVLASRDQPALCYDKGRGVTVLFGGWNASSPGTMYGDTWEYDGVDWTQRSPSNNPIPRYRASLVYDDQRGRLVLYGGFGNATALTDTWEYDGNDWTQVANSGPSRSTQGYAAYDRFRSETVYFGGSGPGGVSNETWTYRGATSAIFAPFGPGCAGSAGIPEIQATSLPKIGNLFGLKVVNLPAAPFTLLLQGFSNLTWGPIALPLDATGAGFAGCRLDVAIDWSGVLPISGGTAIGQLFLPNAPSLLGVPYYTQALTLDAAGPNGVGTLSRAGHAVIGN